MGAGHSHGQGHEAHEHGHADGHSHHGHGHGHGHGHAHAPANFDTAFAAGIALNLGFVAVEAFYGWHVDSLALLADAAHNLGDVAGLVLAWAGVAAARRPPSARYTYGWQRASLMAAFVNAVLLLVAMGSLGWEALQRLREPAAVQAWTVMAVAGAGILVNGATALLFLRGQADDLNIRGAFLHMAGDALVSLGVVLGAALFLWQGWAWIDPVLGLAIAAIIVAGTWNLLRRSLHLLFDGVPEGIDLAAVQQRLQALPGVAGVHDLHVWALGSSRSALTAHLVLAGAADDGGALLERAADELRRGFGIQHATLQLEPADFAARCALRSACHTDEPA